MAKSIVILTGAGISAESGIRTFRDQDGLWENHRLEDVASPEGFERDPDLVYRFYNERRRQLLLPETKPNSAHFALAELERIFRGEFLLITQNVDNLHERAGSKKLLHMHGELLKSRCLITDQVFESQTDFDRNTPCPCCEVPGNLRPHIVWFGEMPFDMDRCYEAISQADFFISIGTSGQVYPAAGFVAHTREDCLGIEINAKGTSISPSFDEHWVGAASIEVPKLLKKILN